MGRPLTLRGRQPTSSYSSSSTGEFRNLLSVLYKVGFCLICNLKLRRKGRGIGGGRSDALVVLDVSLAISDPPSPTFLLLVQFVCKLCVITYHQWTCVIPIVIWPTQPL